MPTPGEVPKLAKEINALISEYQEVKAQIRSQSPRDIALTQPLGLKEIQQQVLDEDTLLLEYSLGDERSYLWAVTPTSITSFELPKRAEIENAALRFNELLIIRSQFYKAVKQNTQSRSAEFYAKNREVVEPAAILSRMLLGPVASQLGKKRLLIVADGALQDVPFAALPLPHRQQRTSLGQKNKGRSTIDGCLMSNAYCPLIIEHEIASLPSASTIAVLRRNAEGRAPAPKTIAVLADPVFDRGDKRVQAGNRDQVTGPREQSVAHDTKQTASETELLDERQLIERLPYTGQEARAILSLLTPGEGTLYIDFEASKAAATSSELSQYRIIHFATHGFINRQHAELSGVTLSMVDRQGQPQDGFLHLHEIYDLKLPAELIVLSACRTALGKQIKGEGLIGLARGFMYAGASRVVASLWKVDDAATAELMKRFYQKMLGKERLRPAEALRAAQVEMWKQKQWETPHYWAAFVLQGEWR
jgi:CHAT domain-containing protein